MKKTVIMLLAIASAISFGKARKFKFEPMDLPQASYRKTIDTITTDNVKSNLDKYFVDMELEGVKYKTFFTEDFNLYKTLKEKMKSYKNIAVFYIPRQKEIVCTAKDALSTLYLNGSEQVDTITRKDVTCTKKSVDKVLTFSEKVKNMDEIGKISLDVDGKVFLNDKNFKKIFK